MYFDELFIKLYSLVCGLFKILFDINSEVMRLINVVS